MKLRIEFLTLYFFVPILILFSRSWLKEMVRGRSFLIVFLPFVATFLLFILFKTNKINRKELFSVPNFWKNFLGILTIFLPISLVLTAVAYFFFDELFLSLSRFSLKLWLLVMCLYPMFSVLPQGIIYRIFFL